MFGYSSENIKNKNINNLIMPKGFSDEAQECFQKLISGKTIKKETVRKTADNKKIKVEVHAFPIEIKKDMIGFYILHNDITERKREEEKIKYLSFHDQLTGLYNRRYFEEQMKTMDKSRRLPVSIIMADLDGLKMANDNYGHAKGDEYIKLTAEMINNSVRTEDVLARIGGDEFAVLLPDTPQEVARNIEKRIQKETQKINETVEYKISVSTGSAVKEDEKTKLREVFKKADSRMYRMKKFSKIK